MIELIKFLKNIDYLYELGFNNKEIEQAMIDSEIIKSDILEEKEVEKLPNWYKYNIIKENHKFTYNKSISGLRGRTKKVRTEVAGYIVEVPSNFQTKNSEILFNLLRNKFNWFLDDIFQKEVIRVYKQKLNFVNLREIPKELRKYTIQELLDNKEITYVGKELLWKVYQGTEIYLNTDIIQHGNPQSIYIPIKALFEKDWNSIVKKHTDYYNDYFRYKPEQLLIAMSSLESPQGIKLKEILNN